MSIKANENLANQAVTASVNHQVVVFGVPDERQSLSQLLIELVKMDPATAQLTSRCLPGLIPVELTRNEAAKVASGIRELGVSAVAVPTAEIPHLSQARQIHHVRVGEVLEIFDGHDQLHAHAWDTITTLSVGVIPSTAPGHHRPASSLAMGSSHHSWNDGVQIASRKGPAAFVVLSSGEALLLASDEMNYEYLGDRMASSSTANFYRLISDLVKHSPQAWITPSTRAFVGRGPVRHYEFRSVEDFRRYTEFQSLLSGQFEALG